ncbi:hypothetical protein LCGC14_1595230 [marine sediment metagenome]|uniref:Uncharacterized protein n=1 Tax=marine sediment metagenome TaxID=412755 RepID=A0A0F9LD54_9ZZZZ
MASLRGNPFGKFISKGVMAVRSARAQQLKAADDRAKRRIATAKTRAEQSRIKSELALERLRLERQAFEAEAAVIKARAETNKARIAAGRLTPLERASGFLRRTSKSIEDLQRANQRRAAPRGRAAPKKKATTRRRRGPDDLSDLFR